MIDDRPQGFPLGVKNILDEFNKGHTIWKIHVEVDSLEDGTYWVILRTKDGAHSLGIQYALGGTEKQFLGCLKRAMESAHEDEVSRKMEIYRKAREAAERRRWFPCS
jgi:hypothetical protein